MLLDCIQILQPYNIPSINVQHVISENDTIRKLIAKENHANTNGDIYRNLDALLDTSLDSSQCHNVDKFGWYNT